MKEAEIAGKLRHRITIQEQNLTPDGAGGFVRSWDDVATVWAEVEPFSGREQVQAEQLAGVVIYRIRMRYRSGVTAAHRLQFGARIFNIRRIITPREIPSLLELLVEEGVAI